MCPGVWKVLILDSSIPPRLQFAWVSQLLCIGSHAYHLSHALEALAMVGRLYRQLINTAIHREYVFARVCHFDDLNAS